MIKFTKQIIAVLIAFVVTGLFFPSCTDQDEINISYKQTLGITAAHIFDSFTPFEDGDFNIQKQGWRLNIDVLYYDKSGVLTTKESFNSDQLEEVFTSSAILTPGEYTVVAIAHFSKKNDSFRYWNISNENNLNDLSIDESHDVYTTPFETLGIHTEKITVTNRPSNLNIDIKPTTALFEVYEIDKMLGYIGYKGKYSIKCLKVAQYNIRTIAYQNNVRFKDGQPTFNVSEQTSNYNFAKSRPYDRMHNNESPNSRSYRAILPENAKQFSWTLYNGEFDADWTVLVSKLVGSYPTEGRSDNKDIISGHQYSLAFMLDAGEFIYEDITGKKYIIDDAINEAFDKYQISKIDKMINFGFEHMVGTSAKTISNIIGVGIESTVQTSSDNYITYFFHSPMTVFEQYVTSIFKEPSCDKAWRIQLQLSLPVRLYGSDIGRAMPENVYQEIWNALNSKYHHFRNVGNRTMFLDGPTKEESKTAIILNGTELDNVYLWYDDVALYLGNGNGDEESKEESNIINTIFPYEWETFLGKSGESIIATFGSNYEFEYDTWVYLNYNSMITFVSFAKFDSDNINSIAIMLNNPTEEVNKAVTEYLKTKFIEISPGRYSDAKDLSDQTVIISYLNGMISYSTL